MHRFDDEVVDLLEPEDLLRPAGEPLRVYEEQRRQARWAFNVCCVFAAIGAAQVVAGIAAVFHPQIAGWATGALLGGGGLFGMLSRWAGQISENANLRRQRIADDEKANELIREISSPENRDAAIRKTLIVLGKRG